MARFGAMKIGKRLLRPRNHQQAAESGGVDRRWMIELLTNPAFSRLPVVHFQPLFERFQPFKVVAGQVVVRQGDPGDYYYIIRSGRAQVTRPGTGTQAIVLADLGPGDVFGEEALLSGDARNATVTMLESGMLMRLLASDFDDLLRKPMVKGLALLEARNLVATGGQLMDVRTEEEFQTGTLEGASNLPLYLLRVKVGMLDTKRPVLLFCDDGRRSATAAFLLSQLGFETHILEQGLPLLHTHSQPSNT